MAARGAGRGGGAARRLAGSGGAAAALRRAEKRPGGGGGAGAGWAASPSPGPAHPRRRPQVGRRPPPRASRLRGNAGEARARVSDDGDAGQPGQELRLPAQVPAGGRQRRGQGRDPGEPAGRRGRIPVRLQQRDRLQDNHHPAGRPAGQAGALGHLGPGPVLHHLQVLLAGCTGLRQAASGSIPSTAASPCSPLGAQGILLVYDITNRWSFDGIDRWIKEIDEHAPGVPRILVGNRLHLAFKRQVPTEQARAYAEKNCMTFFEVSPLCNFNVIESFTELSRIVLMRHGMEKIWRPNRVFSLQDLCCRAIVSCTPVHLIDKLPLPVTIKSHLKSFSMANGMNAVMMHGRSYSLASGAGGGGSKGNSLKRSKSIRPPQSPPQNCSRSNCKIS
ncbi:ras-related protein Rab-40C isoform X1 [Cervus elaphus]|uniref:ras-related protein Rab-40C isoform X1 n=1 Tax=Cervus canadensis TaxID=1574408 RepID=UPI001CA3296F|nr:ras-related protein Rab-40C isoform X1 [Cervus canadensis]XP_043771671.1 ras-related protein Rab-40C isoform X1 [Cervus elaphus]